MTCHGPVEGVATMRLFARKVPTSAPEPLPAPPSLGMPPTPVSRGEKRDPRAARHRFRRRWLGLDIGSSAVKVVELSRSDKSYRVEAFAVEPVPAGTVIAGNISDAVAVGEAIRRACKRAGVRPRNVCAGIRNSAVVTKTLEMDATLDDRALEAAVTREAERHIPFPMEDVAIDFEPMHLSARDPSKVDVLLVACRVEHVAQCQEAAELAGLRLDVVDVESHAAHHALIHAAENRMPVALADIGVATSTVMLVDGESAVTREEQFSLGRDALDDPPDSARVGAVGTSELDSLLALLTRLLRLVLLAGRLESVERLLLAGGGAAIPGFAQRASEHLGMAVEVADAFRGMALSARTDRASLAEHAPALFTASGLAVRGFAEART
ncbi:MAG: type IV pilus assembly protein PilM [Gammaproteobacteria bacterium]|nr:type IV pilus assembly protein PilM [Gammaproteobacteria bacterium]MYF28146.1 type IV pilus assembly protein PilM [Gammaproteobacteria bacterium]MYK47247.1 type IV pilus assembly protein PilM [Gammaproteobacteria bacterium]